MDRNDIDTFYHLLRCISNDNADSFPTSIAYGLSRHLLAGGDYLSLIQFSEWYGEHYILPNAIKIVDTNISKPTRIVEFGGGLGWLGRGLSIHYSLPNTINIDKRPWASVTHVMDLEDFDQLEHITHIIEPDDLLVACDFFHCVENPVKIIRAFPYNCMLMIECRYQNASLRSSYNDQIHRYGSSPIQTISECIPKHRVVFSMSDYSHEYYLVKSVHE